MLFKKFIQGTSKNPNFSLSMPLTKISFYAILFKYFYGGIAQSVEQTAHIR